MRGETEARGGDWMREGGSGTTLASIFKLGIREEFGTTTHAAVAGAGCSLGVAGP